MHDTFKPVLVELHPYRKDLRIIIHTIILGAATCSGVKGLMGTWLLAYSLGLLLAMIPDIRRLVVYALRRKSSLWSFGYMVKGREYEFLRRCDSRQLKCSLEFS